LKQVTRSTIKHLLSLQSNSRPIERVFLSMPRTNPGQTSCLSPKQTFSLKRLSTPDRRTYETQAR